MVVTTKCPPLDADMLRAAEFLEREALALDIAFALSEVCGDTDQFDALAKERHDEMLRLAKRLRRAAGK